MLLLWLTLLPAFLALPPTMETFLDNLGLSQYFDLFIEEEITLPILSQMTEEQLSRLGVTRFGQRFRIMTSVQNLILDDTRDLEPPPQPQPQSDHLPEPQPEPQPLPEPALAELDLDEEGLGLGDPIFYSETLNVKNGTGNYRKSHHFLHGFFRYDLRWVKNNGRGFFRFVILPSPSAFLLCCYCSMQISIFKLLGGLKSK